jgi:hypothetical protein
VILPSTRTSSSASQTAQHGNFQQRIAQAVVPMAQAEPSPGAKEFERPTFEQKIVPIAEYWRDRPDDSLSHHEALNNISRLKSPPSKPIKPGPGLLQRVAFPQATASRSSMSRCSC